MHADRERLRELLGQISDGVPVDWDAARRELPAEDYDQAAALRDVAQIAAFNRVLQRSGDSEDSRGDGTTMESWGDLLLLQQIGSGSAAEVYRAWDLELRREVALKLLRHAPGEGSPIETSPLMVEARAAAAVRHPHIVVVHGIAQHKGRVGLWMELVKGDSLEELVRRRGQLSAVEVRELGQQIASAAEAMHAVDLLHRDIKPSNVVRDESGRWVLTDFGLGSRSGTRASELAWATGTPMYMAPELLEGSPHSTVTEVYALGMLLRFALTARHPFEVGVLAELRELTKIGPRPSLAELRPDLPTELVRAIDMAIAPDPGDRPLGMRELAAALARDVPSDAEMSAAPSRRSRIRPLVLVPLVIVALVIALVGRRDGETHRGTAGQTFDVEAALLLHHDGGAQRLVDGDRVQPGDQLSLQVRVSRPVWVYVLNEDEQGERYLLFPQPAFDLGNPIAADSLLLLPGPMRGVRNAWTVTSAGGREHFLIVVSPEPVDDLQAEIDRLPAPRSGQAVHYARVGEEAVQRLRGVGGLSVVNDGQSARTADGSEDELVFARFRALAGRETAVRGIWVRHVVLENTPR